MTKIKTDLEQKIYLLDSLKGVMDSVNSHGGSITEDTPYGEYGNKIREVFTVSKGSFDSTTQQLTLNYDYLVDKINSSTVVTDEQKSGMIALLNNQSLVIDMTSEPETMPENDYVYGFMMTAGGTGVGESYVDKQTPVTLKLVVTPESLGIIGSYEAAAGFFTQISGETTTPEMVEAQYGQFIVDDNLCTVSGTFGNFSVEFN